METGQIKAPPPVLEFAGIPGSGKTRIMRALQAKHLARDEISIFAARLNWKTFQIFLSAFRLALSARPLASHRVIQAFKIFFFFRHYRRHRQLPVILDQGLAQKLWSMLVESQSFSLFMLHQTIQKMAPLVADHLIWIETPSETAAQRIVSRPNGKSRFDGRPQDEVTARLEASLKLYHLILEIFESQTKSRVLRLSGEDTVAHNVAQVRELLD